MRPWGDVDRKSMLGCSIARCNRVPPASEHASLGWGSSISGVTGLLARTLCRFRRSASQEHAAVRPLLGFGQDICDD